MECWPLLSTVFTLFSFLFSLLKSANTSADVGSTKQCFQILLESRSLTLPLCQNSEPVVHSSVVLCRTCFSCCSQFQQQAGGRSCSCRCKASKNLSQLGSSCAGHPGGIRERRFCQTLCVAEASRLSSEVFWELLCFLSSRMYAHKWGELEKGLPHLQLLKSPVCSFSRSMGFHGIVVFFW